MGVYIKGMEMPTSCSDCWFRKTARHEYLSDCQLCPFTGDTTPYLTRDKKCPLIPVPPHGRLADADEVKRIVQEHDYLLRDPILNSTDRGMWTIGVFQAIDEAPTIIPAEEGE